MTTKINSLAKIAGMALAASAVVGLNFPAEANNSTATSQNLYAQSSQSGSQSSPNNSQSSPGNAQSPGGTQTPKSDTQSVRDPNLIPGGWMCLNNPNPGCRS